MRVLAIEARREGVAFETYWERSVRPGRKPLITTNTEHPPPEAVVWPADSSNRAIAISAALATKDGWRRCYEQIPPTKPERSLSTVRHLFAESSGSEDRSGLSLAAPL
jgi:hypothetical protein